jgi:hypothetical protein
MPKYLANTLSLIRNKQPAQGAALIKAIIVRPYPIID